MQSNFAEKDPKLTNATLLSAFNMPPEEAIKYLKGKGIEVDFDWKTAKAEAKAKAFAITGQNNINVLSRFKDKMEQALKEGQSFSDFKKSLTADGIQSIPRMKVIFQTNIQTAYMAGRYREQISNVKRNPYWRFRAVLDNSTTTICTGLNNKVFKYDNPIWDKFYPPNHFGCRSRVEVLNDSDLLELGLKLSNDLPDGVDLPSNGFDYNPGKSAGWDRNGWKPECGTISFSDSDGGKKCIKIVEVLSFLDFGRPPVKSLKDEQFTESPELLEKQETIDAALKVLSNTLGITEQNPVIFVKTPIETVGIKMEYLFHIVEKRDDARERFSKYVIPTLESPFEIYSTKFEDETRRQYIKLFKGKYNLLCSVRINPDGTILWNVINVRQKEVDKKRLGLLLFGEPIK